MEYQPPHMMQGSPTRAPLPQGTAQAPISASGDLLLSDLELARIVAGGRADSRQALEELFLRHAAPLIRFLQAKVGSREEPEDMAHDVFVKLSEKAGSYRGEAPFRTWLFALAFNQARSRQRRTALADRADRHLHARRPELALPRPESDPAWNAQRQEHWSQVQQALQGLGDEDREIFQLYWFGELSYAEISQLAGVTVAAAKVRVHRALKQLSKSVQELA